MAVTRRPNVFKRVPVLDAITPLPIPEMTPPETTIYLVMFSNNNSGERKKEKNIERNFIFYSKDQGQDSRVTPDRSKPQTRKNYKQATEGHTGNKTCV